ncbi:TetR/AcrR family transcriptional regulator [Micromonospora auratinigra]|uniref:Transcriptional regulator, TetR family n=1 Tax=Micromonospora auratinigra TaxID=261654 RepID=A0A1A8ZMV9_9ACTN|nr:TetR/AcrR family transcriptional regulator [Micromonospora auratinigra]SBT45155.1 transcriptional regulator, TetR family [Micromonospora auratinigra]
MAQPPRGDAERVGRAEQKRRTREALVAACRDLIRSGELVTMPAVAAGAGVSEATAYRHFPDLVTLANESLAGLWPTPEEALSPVADCADPVERAAFACEFLLRRVHAFQGSVRAVIAATIVRPGGAAARPGFRFGLIDTALDPVLPAPDDATRARLRQLKQDLAAVVSAEAFFTLTDLVGLRPDEAIASLTRTTRTVVAAGLAELDRTGR